MPPKTVKSAKVVKETASHAKVKKDKAAPKQARSAYTFYLEQVCEILNACDHFLYSLSVSFLTVSFHHKISRLMPRSRRKIPTLRLAKFRN